MLEKLVWNVFGNEVCVCDSAYPENSYSACDHQWSSVALNQ